VHSLAVQARWLVKRLERHRLGNHLIANAKALVFAGAFFGGREADEWRAIGTAVLRSELKEQVLPDGGHYELSPMYHSIVLEDLIDLLNLRSLYSNLRLEFTDDDFGLVGLMLDWLGAMTHPEVQIALFNDAAFDVALDPKALVTYASYLGANGAWAPQDGCTHLRESGYVRIQLGDAVALLDVGHVGPDRCPGHCHADTLSFELSLFGERTLVNSGVSQYGRGRARDDQRGTASHNTVMVEGRNSSDVWGGFRVGRRARVSGLELSVADARIEVTARHDGYRHLPGRPRHVRAWHMSTTELVIRDSVLPARDAVAIYHMPSAVAATASGWDCRVGGRPVRLLCQDGASWEDSQWHPKFGSSLPARRLLAPLRGGTGVVSIRWD
jgi:uncharacterized heparinase superfamily protein